MSSSAVPQVPGVEVRGDWKDGYEQVLTEQSLSLLAQLQREFGGRRRELLELRAQRDAELAGGAVPDFLAETAEVRGGDWTVAPPAPGLVDRRVEITGPTDRKMVINALNCGAKVFLADEDSNTPTFDNLVTSQLNLRDAWLRQIDFTSEQGKSYALNHTVATLVGEVTEEGVRNNVSVGIQYLESWLRGGGAVAIFNLMEDAATAEISRSQIWQWVHNGVTTAEGTPITPEWVRQIEDEELEKVRAAVVDERFSAGRYDEARELFEQVALADDFEEFLTLPAYERLG